MVNGEILFELLNTKKMGKAEKSFHDNLMNGLSKQLILSTNFLNTNEFGRVNKSVDDDFDEWFITTSLYDDLDILMKENVVSSGDYINRFYMSGSRLGYNQLKKRNNSSFNSYDNESLRILREYTDDLVYDLNKELAVGVRDTLHEGIENNESPNIIKNNMLGLLTIPILSAVNLENRSEMIARTEYSRGINTGTLQAYSNSGVTEANIITSGMSNVCDDCLELESNNPYTLEEAMELLPFHPLCNCSYEPIENANASDEVLIIDLTE